MIVLKFEKKKIEIKNSSTDLLKRDFELFVNLEPALVHLLEGGRLFGQVL
jgi:hypothetical protein